MTRAAVSLPDPRYALLAPAEVVAEVGKILPLRADGPAPRSSAVLFRVDAHREGYRIRGGGLRERRLRRPADVATHLCLALGEHRLADRGERLAIHAGAVVEGGRAIVLAGDPEAGKTSCTFHLLEMGCAFLAEEIVSVDQRGRAEPFPQALALGHPLLAEQRSRFGELRGGRRIAGEGVFDWYRPRRFARRAVPVSTIVLPRYRPGQRSRLHRRPPSEALVELLGYCYPPLGDEERYFERAMALADSAAIFELRYGDAGEARRRLAEAVEAGR